MQKRVSLSAVAAIMLFAIGKSTKDSLENTSEKMFGSP